MGQDRSPGGHHNLYIVNTVGGRIYLAELLSLLQVGSKPIKFFIVSSLGQVQARQGVDAVQ